MVAAVEPSWSVADVRPAEEGTASVFFLRVETPAGDREVVLKVFSGTVSPRTARSEPRLLGLVDDETTIPVPEVVGFADEHPDLPAPFFLAERLHGENGSGRFGELSTEALERVLSEAGAHLAELHELRSFDRFGRVGVANDALAVVGDGCEPAERWSDWLLADVEDTLAKLERSRFDDLVTPLREHVRESIPALDGPETASLVHWDYRLGNLLLDPESGETTAVLDWASLVAGDPAYNLATVEDHNVNWQTRDVVLRRRLRDRFRGAYAARRTDSLGEFRARKRLYHLCNRLDAMVCLPEWYANADEAIRDERAAEHRAFVRDYLD